MPHEEDELTPAERELEAAISRLMPAAPSFGPQQIEVRGLIARERRRTRVWQGVAAALTVGLGAALWLRAAVPPRTLEKIVIREVERPAEVRWTAAPPREPDRAVVSFASPADYAYLQLRQRVLTRGAESLIASRSVGPSRQTPSALGPASATHRPIQSETPSLIDYLLSGGRS